jgi:hypothetical protein
MVYTPITRTLRHYNGKTIRVLKPVNESKEHTIPVLIEDKEDIFYEFIKQWAKSARRMHAASERLQQAIKSN